MTGMRRVAILTASLLAILGSTARATPGWVHYVNERFGFSLRYPADQFEPERSSEAGDGAVFAHVGGRGRLLVGAFENSEAHTLASYMSMIRKESYSGYRVDYAPRGGTWFVLSGEDERDVFYEKVMFSCGRRIINSFALKYPVENKREFAPIIAGIEKSFRPGTNCNDVAGR